MKHFLLLIGIVLAVAITSCHKDQKEIIVQPGTNTLAKILEDAAPGSTIRLASGTHTEQSPVVINKSINLIGEEGAVLKVATDPNPLLTQNAIQAAVYIMDAGNTCIQGIDIQPLETPGNTGVFIENSPDSKVQGCEISGHYLGIVVQSSDRSMILDNQITGILSTHNYAHGIVWIGGKKAEIHDNSISDCFFALWPCDEDCTFEGNLVTLSAYGVVPCKVIRKISMFSPRGDSVYASLTATHWTIKGNEFHHNQWGVALADESNQCNVEDNIFHHNGNQYFTHDSTRNGYDIELVGDYPEGNTRFGVAVTAGYNNTIKAAPTDRIKDCSFKPNIISGGIIITNDTCD